MDDSSSTYVLDHAPSTFYDRLFTRRTQILPLELVAVYLALQIYGKRRRGSQFIFFIDNTAALASLSKGASRAPDVNNLVHATWRLAHRLDIELFLFWVPTKFNLADEPSRGRRPLFGSRTRSSGAWSRVLAALDEMPVW